MADDTGRQPATAPGRFGAVAIFFRVQDLLAARSQMAVSLGFHITFASIGMAIFFATGAVSGMAFLLEAIALGLFAVCLFSFLAAVYLIGESPAGPIRRQFTRRTAVASTAIRNRSRRWEAAGV